MEATVLDSHDYRAVPTARTHALSVVAGLECALLGMLSVGTAVYKSGILSQKVGSGQVIEPRDGADQTYDAG